MCAPALGLLRICVVEKSIELRNRNDINVRISVSPSDGRLEAGILRFEVGNNIVEWIVLPSKSNFGLRKDEWRKLWDKALVDVEHLTERGWQSLF